MTVVETCLYQIGAAIIHIGTEIENGHYVCMERTIDGMIIEHNDIQTTLHQDKDFGKMGYFLRLDRVKKD